MNQDAEHLRLLMRPSVRKAFGLATDDGTGEPDVYA